MLNKNDKVYFEDKKYTVYVNCQGNIKVLRHEDGKKLDYVNHVYCNPKIISRGAAKACNQLHGMFQNQFSMRDIFPSYYKKEKGSK